MIGTNTPPALLLIAAALLVLFLPPRARKGLAIIAPLSALAWILTLPNGLTLLNQNEVDWPLFVFRLQVDPLSRIFGVIFSLITAVAALYHFATATRRESVAQMFYCAGALGVVFAGDYVSLYFFWELMALSSFFLITAREQAASWQAGLRYLYMHLAGGVLLLAGILLQSNDVAPIHITVQALVSGQPSVGAYLILAGFALNAAAIPLHAWLPDAYPKASIGGAVLLSALTTKTAVYVLARVFAGWEILIIAGCVMAVYGVVMAFLCDDIRKILAYHIISQVGYMVAGIGIGTELAVSGAVAHAFCHILYKALLFMGCGAVIYTCGRERLSELGGLLKSQWAICLLYMVGAVSISGFPFFNGFISKSMVVAAAEEAHLTWVYLALEIAAVGTFLSVGLKLPYFTWFGTKQETGGRRQEEKPLPKSMYAAMGFTAFACLLLGLYPQLLYRFLPVAVDYEPYTASHLIRSAELLCFTALAFFLIGARLEIKATTLLDIDWLYRRLSPLAATLFIVLPQKLFHSVEGFSEQVAHALARFSRNPSALLHQSISRRPLALDYDPNRQRLPMAWLAGSLLVTFVLLSLWTLL